MARNELADIAFTIERNPDMGQQTVLVLLDPERVTPDLERLVGQFVDDHGTLGHPEILVLCEKRPSFTVETIPVMTLVVPDIARIAAAFGAPVLPWAMLTGSVTETRMRIDVIVNQYRGPATSRGSGAISAGELH